MDITTTTFVSFLAVISVGTESLAKAHLRITKTAASTKRFSPYGKSPATPLPASVRSLRHQKEIGAEDLVMASKGVEMPSPQGDLQTSTSSLPSGVDPTAVDVDETVADMADVDSDGFKLNEDGSLHSYGSEESISGRSRTGDQPQLSDPWASLSLKDQPPQSLGEAAASSATDSFRNVEAQQANAAPVHRKGIPKAAKQKVAIKNCTGQCQGERTATAEAKVGAPSAVNNLTVKQTLPQEAVYSWERPDIPNGPIDGYIVSTGNLETKKVSITEVPGNTTTLTEKTIEQYTKYKVDVQAYNVMNPYGLKQAGPAASLEFESVGEGPIPPIPEVADIYEHEVLVNWTEPADLQHHVTYYTVRLEKTAVEVTTTDNSVWLDGLETWCQYTISVSSCTLKDKCGPQKKAYFQTDVGTPAMPRQLNSTSVSRYSLGVTWAPPEEAKGPIDGYRVIVTNESLEFEVIAKSTELTLSNLTPSCLYKIAVMGFNNGAHRIKEGPAAVIDVTTLYGPKPTPQWFSITTITLMIVVPVVCFVFLVGYVVYRQVLKKREDEELLASSE